MRIHLRRWMLALFAAAAVATGFAIPTGHTTILADEVCLNGHNWDNIRRICV